MTLNYLSQDQIPDNSGSNSIETGFCEGKQYLWNFEGGKNVLISAIITVDLLIQHYGCLITAFDLALIWRMEFTWDHVEDPEKMPLYLQVPGVQRLWFCSCSMTAICDDQGLIFELTITQYEICYLKDHDKGTGLTLCADHLDISTDDMPIAFG